MPANTVVMIRRPKVHPLETIAMAGALALFGGACGWSAWMVLGSPLAGAAATIAAGAIGALALRQFGRPAQPRFTIFDMESLTIGDDDETAIPTSGDELLLDDVLLPNTLWLDDPVPPRKTDSRVVRLFAGEPATPGELVERISEYLVDQGGLATFADPPIQPAADASADLYAALANIRASLR